MKTKLFKTYFRAAKTATTKVVFVEDTDVMVFAHCSGLIDNNIDVLERAFSWTTNQIRVLRVFKMSNGDYGFRWYEGNMNDDIAMNDNIADRVFSDLAIATKYLNDAANEYITNEIWEEVFRV